MNSELKAKMNSILADFNVLYMKLHHFHWFVKGPHFFTLHEKFEELYDEVAEHSDEVAERILQLQESPISTLKESLERSSLKEASEISTDVEMVNELLGDLNILNEKLLDAVEEAGNAGDEGTVDILLGMSQSFEKHIWMFRAFNG